MKFEFTARKRGDGEEYFPIKEHGLMVGIQEKGGNGTPDNPILFQIKITNTNQAGWYGVIHCSMSFEKKKPLFFLPGFMYGTNRGDAPMSRFREFPHLREGENRRPASGWWMVRGDHLSHPVAMVFQNGRLFGFSASPYFIKQQEKKVQWAAGEDGEFIQYSGFTCSIQDGYIGYTLGYENAPWLFVQSQDVRERLPLAENCFELSAGESVFFSIKVYDFAAEDERAVHQVIEKVYQEYHEKPRKAAQIDETINDLAGAISEYAWIEKEKLYAGIVYLHSDQTIEHVKIPSIAWTNGLVVAIPMLMSAFRLGNSLMRNQALACIQHIVDHSLNLRTNLPYEAYCEAQWNNRGWWYDYLHNPGHTSYVTGQALYFLLKAYDFEKNHYNVEHNDWVDFIKKVAAALEKTKNAEDEYPYIISENSGIGIEYDSFCGAWILAALAYYCYLFHDKEMFKGLIKSEEHYYDAFVKKLQCYGGPLDTEKAIDSEGILAYIRAVRLLHMITGRDMYLNHLRDALCYEFSFKFCYNSPVKVPPLSRIGWSSCGGSITSVANPHIHPMSSTVTDEMLYYIRHRRDAYIESRLKDVIGWGLQCHNRFDGEFDYGLKGWMSERFCHCEGLLAQKYSDGSFASTWFALMPWAGSSILEGLTGDCWEEFRARTDIL